MKTQLLCTFSNTRRIEDTLKGIKAHYDVVFDKIFILQDEDNPDDLFCTYNIDRQGHNRRMSKTISVHRKKETNTIYTINALNSLIIELNGKIDKSYPIPWEDYQNKILLTVNNELKEISTTLFDIEHFDEDGFASY